MGKRVERDENGLTRFQRKAAIAKAIAKARTARVEKARHALRMAEPNPACRYGPVVPDRPQDILFNEACRKYERENE